MSEVLDGSESGLRARKRQRTGDEILANAIALFKRHGIRAARLNEIALRSDISQATLFNYFPTKGALAEAWVRGEIERCFQETSSELVDRGLRSAMRILCLRIARLVGGSDDRVVRIEAWYEASRARRRVVSEEHVLVRALLSAQESERVRRDLDPLALAELLLDAIEGGMIAGLRQEMTEEGLARSLRARVDLILDGLRKRNERVVVPTAWATRPVQSR